MAEAHQKLIIDFHLEDGEMNVTYLLAPNENILKQECSQEQADAYNLALVCCNQVYEYLKKEMK